MRVGILLFILSVLGASYSFCQKKVNCESKEFVTPALLRIDFTLQSQDTSVIPRVTLGEVSYEKLPECNHIINMDTSFMGNYRLVLSRKGGKVLYFKGFSSVYDEWILLDSTQRGNKRFEHSLIVPFPNKKFYITLQRRMKNGDFETIFETIAPKPKKLLPSHSPASFLSVNPDNNTQLNLVIVSDNYRKDEMIEFLTQSNDIVQQFFSTQPFADYQSNFNVAIVENPSENNVSIVERNFLGVERYVGIKSMWQIENLLTGIPHDFVIILHKSNEYLGAGVFNQYVIIPSEHAETVNLLRHELGHYMFGLADEYVDEKTQFFRLYDSIVEPWEVNISKNPHHPKWITSQTNKQSQALSKTSADINLVSKQPVSIKDNVFEGAGYKPKGIYRPYNTCAMRHIEDEFCPVCNDHIVHLLNLWSSHSNKY